MLYSYAYKAGQANLILFYLYSSSHFLPQCSTTVLRSIPSHLLRLRSSTSLICYQSDLQDVARVLEMLCKKQKCLRCYSEFISTLGKLNNMHDHGGNRTYDLWNASPMLCQLTTYAEYMYKTKTHVNFVACYGIFSVNFYIIHVRYLVGKCSQTSSERFVVLPGTR